MTTTTKKQIAGKYRVSDNYTFRVYYYYDSSKFTVERSVFDGDFWEEDILHFSYSDLKEWISELGAFRCAQ